MDKVTQQHYMALMNYLNKASGVVPITMAEGGILSPAFETINALARGTHTVEPVKVAETKEETPAS